jgi:hypothetical protein
MTHTFKAQKEVLIDCNDAGISFTQNNGVNEDDDFIHFEWSRVPELIEALEVMNHKWTEASIL